MVHVDPMNNKPFCETPRVISEPSKLSALQAMRQYLVWDSESIEECQDTILEQMFESVDQDTSDEESSDDKKKKKKKSLRKKKVTSLTLHLTMERSHQHLPARRLMG